MSLGGLALLDTNGMVAYVDRPMFNSAEHYAGKPFWNYSQTPETMRKLQQSFAWTLAMGESLEFQATSGGGIPAATFRVRFRRVICSTPCVISQYSTHRPDTLTPTERNVAALIVRDHKLSAICKQLGISKSTFETHRLHIYDKLSLRGPAGLALWWAEQQRWA